MSTDYRPRTPISFTQLFDGRLERFGVMESVNPGTKPWYRCLTDGTNYLWVENTGSFVITCRGDNDPRRISAAIDEAFGPHVEWVDEEAWEAEVRDSPSVPLHEVVMEYVRGDDAAIPPTLIGAIARAAKSLIASNAQLALPENAHDLIHSASMHAWLNAEGPSST